MKWIDKNLHIKPINTHIDPYKPVENAIITHGHADHAKPGHNNVLATKETIEKLGYNDNLGQSGATFKVINPINSIENVVSVLKSLLKVE